MINSVTSVNSLLQTYDHPHCSYFVTVENRAKPVHLFPQLPLAYYSKHKSLSSTFSENFQCLHSISSFSSLIFLCYLLGNCIFSEVVFLECLCLGEQKWEQYPLGAMKPIFIAGKVKVRKEMNMNCSNNMFMASTIHLAVCSSVSLKEHREIQSEGYWIGGKGVRNNYCRQNIFR